jgi:endonuclease III
VNEVKQEIKMQLKVHVDRDDWKGMVSVPESDVDFSIQILFSLLLSHLTSDSMLRPVCEHLFTDFPSIASIVTQPPHIVKKQLMMILAPLGIQAVKAHYLIWTAHDLVRMWLSPEGTEDPPLTKKSTQLPLRHYTLQDITGIPSAKEILQKVGVTKDGGYPILLDLHGVGLKCAHLFMITVYHMNTGIPVDRHVRRFAISFCQGMAGWPDDRLCNFLGEVYQPKHYESVNEIAAGVAQMLANKVSKTILSQALRKMAKTTKCTDEMECFLSFYSV